MQGQRTPPPNIICSAEKSPWRGISPYNSENITELEIKHIEQHGVLTKHQMLTDSGTSDFAPRTSKIRQVTTTDKVCVVKSRAIQDLHNVLPSNHMLSSQNLQ